MRLQNATRSGGSGAATSKKFTAPTSGLEDVYFTWGTAKNAAKFEDTVSQLARHVGTRNWQQSSVASKAMSTIRAPVIEEPTRPVREYWADADRTQRTNNNMGGTDVAPVPNQPVKEDWDHNLDVDDYKLKLKIFWEQTPTWKENKAKCYYLVLSHCPKELEQELRNSTRWSETEDDQDVVALLEMIRDITYPSWPSLLFYIYFKERKESVMTIVESDVELFTIVQ